MKTPICEECDLELHRFGTEIQGKYVEGWCCDGCGWSWDDEEYLDYKDEPIVTTPHHSNNISDEVTATFLLNNPDCLFANIVRMWDQEKIVRFAKHLLGEECQKCEKI